MKPYRARTFADPEIQRFVDEISKERADDIKQGVPHAGVEFVGIALTTTDKELVHNLGRVPTRVLSVWQNSAGVPFVVTQHATPRTHIYVRASAAVTCNLVVA